MWCHGFRGRRHFQIEFRLGFPFFFQTIFDKYCCSVFYVIVDGGLNTIQALSTVKSKFYALRMSESENIIEYLNRIEECLFTLNASKEMALSEEELIAKTISGLAPSWRSFGNA